MSPSSSCLSQYCLLPSPYPMLDPIFSHPVSAQFNNKTYPILLFFFLSLSNPLCISSLVSGMGIVMVCGLLNWVVKLKKPNSSSLSCDLISVLLQVPVVLYDFQLSLTMLQLLYGWKMLISCSCSQCTENKIWCGVQL